MPLVVKGLTLHRLIDTGYRLFLSACQAICECGVGAMNFSCLLARSDRKVTAFSSFSMYQTSLLDFIVPIRRPQHLLHSPTLQSLQQLL